MDAQGLPLLEGEGHALEPLGVPGAQIVNVTITLETVETGEMPSTIETMKTTPPKVVTARHEAGSHVRAAGPREAWGAPARKG